MMKYKYTGSQIVNIPYRGTFEPDRTYEVSESIDHPDFELITREIIDIDNQEK